VDEINPLQTTFKQRCTVSRRVSLLIRAAEVKHSCCTDLFLLKYIDLLRGNGTKKKEQTSPALGLSFKGESYQSQVACTMCLFKGTESLQQVLTKIFSQIYHTFP